MSRRFTNAAPFVTSLTTLAKRRHLLSSRAREEYVAQQAAIPFQYI